MPKDSRALTRAARARMAAAGETCTQARAGLLAPPQMDRDTPPDNLVAALMFGELMAAGRRAAITAPAGLAAAAAAVQTAITPLWPQVVPEAARDVLVACAQLAVSRGITALPAGIEDETAAAMLELTAAQPASGSPGTAGGFAPPVAYASSAAFDRDEDAATLSALALLMALAHPAAPGRPAGDDEEDYNERYALSGYNDLDEEDPDEVRGLWCTQCGANTHYECHCDDDEGYE
jgi:hypothetical protein